MNRAPRWQRIGPLAILAFAFLVVGCGNSGGIDEALTAIPDGVPAHVLEEVSDFQRAIASDGVVDLDEYERSVLSTIACLESRGVWVSEARYDEERSRFSFDFGGVSTEAEARAVERSYKDCYELYQDLVDQIWAIQTGPTQAEEQEFYATVLACVSALGYDVPSDPTPANLDAAIAVAGEDYVQCFDRVLQIPEEPGRAD